MASPFETPSAIDGLMPVGAAMSWRVDYIWLHTVADTAIAIACVCAGLSVLRLAFWNGRRTIGDIGLLVVTAACALMLGLVHMASVITLWQPWHLSFGALKTAAALVSICAAWILARRAFGATRKPANLAPTAPLALVEGRTPQDKDAEQAFREVSDSLSFDDAKSAQLTSRQAFFEIATENAQITLFCQDRDLRYLWVHNPRLGYSVEELVGLTDFDVLPKQGRDRIIEVKYRVFATGEPETFEVEVPEGDSTSWFQVTTTPLKNDSEEVVSIVSTAVDITRAKRLETMRRDLTGRLSETIQRLSVALRATGVFVFSQDQDLRYLWVSAPNDTLGLRVGDLETERQADTAGLRSISLKRQVMESGGGAMDEIAVNDAEQSRWFQLNVEPTRGGDGQIVGVTGALTDITTLKRHEEQMRVVMRELSHRSKNLLAVIQAVARQTAQTAPDLDVFVRGFADRLRSIALAQDLLVAVDWESTTLNGLIEGQLNPYLPREGGRVRVEGPPVSLSAQATQTLALAFHELTTNAIKYGALSNERGTLEVVWCLTQRDGESYLQLCWRELGGPLVSEPLTRGFGRTVIEDNVATVLSADITLSFAPEGLEARFEIPSKNLAV
ncbi:HWE histidine kinase domain-containing protein [Algihabitans albus]|uniref:HWE histidine kinase domain-containing protein n=1 Tax=Algihabitans albus TaxID=2164067 RepID=UPI000E5C840C|nr:HWE histidine kinase domain-containing protein [Algihabitans albus]